MCERVIRVTLLKNYYCQKSTGILLLDIYHMNVLLLHLLFQILMIALEIHVPAAVLVLMAWTPTLVHARQAIPVPPAVLVSSLSTL